MEYPLVTATVETLANGLTLIMDPDATAPVVNLQIWVASGSMHEGDLLGSGVAHFLEHMVFKGTRDFSGGALADTVQAAGGHWNAYTSFDRTVYYIDGPAASLPVFLKCLTGLVFFPILPESEFAKEQDVIRREIDMSMDDPDQAAMRLMFGTAFHLDPRRHPVIGHRHHFDTLTHGDLVATQRARYTPDRCHLVVSGDFNPEEIRDQVEALTRDAMHGGGAEPVVPHDPPQLGRRSAQGCYAVPTSRLSMAWKAPALGAPDTPALELLAALLGRGRASRLYRNLREDRSLALGISAYLWNQPEREGLFGIGAECQLANKDELVAAILDEMQALQVVALDEDLAKAKRQMMVSQFAHLTTASGRASDLASNWHDARDLDFTRRQLARIEAVTVEDLRRVALRLTEDYLTVSALDPLGTPAARAHGRARREREGPEVHTLASGLRVAMIADRRVPLVHLEVAVRAGLPSESSATHGLNRLLAATMPKGTRHRTAQQIANTLEALGASISASTGNNSLMVHGGGLNEDLATLVEILADVLIHPEFPADAVAREQASQLAALEEALQDPLHVAFRTMREAHFGNAGYGLDMLGSLQSVRALGREELLAQHAGHVNLANMTLAIAGDFDRARLIDLLEQHFAAMPAGVPWQAPASCYAGGGAELTRHLPKKQAVLVLGYPGVGVSHPDRHAMGMVAEYASDMAGPLFGRIREDLGLAYQVGANQFLGFDAGIFACYLSTSPDQLPLARQELLAEMAKIAEHGIPAEAFERVRATILSGLAIQQQSNSQRARHAALDMLYGQPADFYLKLPTIYRNLTIVEVKEAAARVFTLAPTVATVTPAEG